VFGAGAPDTRGKIAALLCALGRFAGAVEVVFSPRKKPVVRVPGILLHPILFKK
jgi:hypothetical protein